MDMNAHEAGSAVILIAVAIGAIPLSLLAARVLRVPEALARLRAGPRGWESAAALICLGCAGGSLLGLFPALLDPAGATIAAVAALGAIVLAARALSPDAARSDDGCARPEADSTSRRRAA